MPLPASCYVNPPAPWVWPGRGSVVAVTRVRGPQPPTSTTGLSGLPGPAALPLGPSDVGPTAVPPPSTTLKNTSPPPPPTPPPHFRGFFSGATPPFIPMAPPSSVNIAAPPQMPQDVETFPQGPPPEMVKGWKDELLQDMKSYWQQLIGDAPPQSTVGPAVSHENMGPDALRQLSPSDDREASRAQHKSGSKRAGSDSRRHSGSHERSSVDLYRARVRRPPTSPDSPSPTRHRSPPPKRSRPDRREMSNDSCSSEGRQRSTRPRRPCYSRSPGRRRRDSSHSPSPHRRYRSSPAPSRRSSGAGMTKRLAGRPSPLPLRRSSRRSRHSSRDCHSSPPPRSRGSHYRMSSSSSRSPSPKRRRTDSISPQCHGSRSPSLERNTHPYDSDIRLLRLRADNDDEQYPASTHPRNSPEPGKSTSVDASILSAEKVQKLFADLIPPPALSHYADPIPDSASNKQLVPYVHTPTSTASNLQNSEPLETHGLFQNYQSFHRLSGDTEKEACTAAYHDLTNLMLSQTEESPLINVSSSRPKTEEPFPCGAISSNEMKKKHEKLHLQWPPQDVHKKVINRTLGLYQHGPPPKAGTADKWPPPTVQNPWEKTFVPKEFPTTHKIPSSMPKRWDLHSSSPLMLRPPQSTAVTEVPDSEISKSSSWLEAFAARAAHTAMMSATSIVAIYNFQQKVLRFLRDSASKNNIQNDISLVDDVIQRANSMALEAHIMAHDSGVTATELFTHLHMLHRRSVLEAPTVTLPQHDKDRLLVLPVGSNDLFGPDARKVHEWKLDTEEENVKLIARVFDERAQRDKPKKKPSSSESRPPRSVDHRSPLAFTAQTQRLIYPETRAVLSATP